jgi:hypothetical protein
MPTEFEAIFTRLRTILQNHAGKLSVKEDSPTCYCLAGGLHPTQKKPISIAWVQIGKTYVSYHLMPVYACPELLNRFSAKLKARMQGKSCFNFKGGDEALFKELEKLTVEGFAAFKKTGYMS